MSKGVGLVKNSGEQRQLLPIIAEVLVLAALAFALLLEIRPVIVISGSMEPAIPVGSICLISGADCSGAPGKIVAYEMADTLVVHRISSYDKSEDSFITKGDNNNVQDPIPVSAEQIRGSVLGAIPYAGYAISFLINHKSAIFVAGGIIFIGYVCFRRRENV